MSCLSDCVRQMYFQQLVNRANVWVSARFQSALDIIFDHSPFHEGYFDIDTSGWSVNYNDPVNGAPIECSLMNRHTLYIIK